MKALLAGLFSILLFLQVAMSLASAAEPLELPVPDIEPPVIVFDESDAEIEAGIATFTAAVADNVGVAKVTLFYRSQTDTVFKTKPMQRSNKVPDLYTAELPLDSIESDDLEYYIRADDVSGNSIFKGQRFSPLTFKVVPKLGASSISRSTEVSGEDVYEFYGKAEQEINSNSYDRNLWAKALIMVEGDEQKRKVKYIELRAKQLFLINSGSTSNSNLSEASSLSVDITGNYISDITSNSQWAFNKRKDQRLLITFEQTGNEITGINSRTNLKITGTRQGDIITFFLWPSVISTTEIKGKWKVNADGTKLKGNWSYPAGSGKWNLTKIE